MLQKQQQQQPQDMQPQEQQDEQVKPALVLFEDEDIVNKPAAQLRARSGATSDINDPHASIPDAAENEVLSGPLEQTSGLELPANSVLPGIAAGADAMFEANGMSAVSSNTLFCSDPLLPFPEQQLHNTAACSNGQSNSDAAASNAASDVYGLLPASVLSENALGMPATQTGLATDSALAPDGPPFLTDLLAVNQAHSGLTSSLSANELKSGEPMSSSLNFTSNNDSVAAVAAAAAAAAAANAVAASVTGYQFPFVPSLSPMPLLSLPFSSPPSDQQKEQHANQILGSNGLTAAPAITYLMRSPFGLVPASPAHDPKTLQAMSMSSLPLVSPLLLSQNYNTFNSANMSSYLANMASKPVTAEASKSTSLEANHAVNQAMPANTDPVKVPQKRPRSSKARLLEIFPEYKKHKRITSYTSMFGQRAVREIRPICPNNITSSVLSADNARYSATSRSDINLRHFSYLSSMQSRARSAGISHEHDVEDEDEYDEDEYDEDELDSMNEDEDEEHGKDDYDDLDNFYSKRKKTRTSIGSSEELDKTKSSAAKKVSSTVDRSFDPRLLLPVDSLPWEDYVVWSPPETLPAVSEKPASGVSPNEAARFVPRNPYLEDTQWLQNWQPPSPRHVNIPLSPVTPQSWSQGQNLSSQVAPKQQNTAIALKQSPQRGMLVFEEPSQSVFTFDLKNRYAVDFLNVSNDAVYRVAQEIAASFHARSSIFLQHSPPALRLFSPFYKTELEPRELRTLHRTCFRGEPGTWFEISRARALRKKKIKGKENMELLRSARDLTLRDSGNFTLMEYSEEIPLMLSNKGMASLVFNFYRKRDDRDTFCPNLEIGAPNLLKPKEEDKPFFGMGWVEPGTTMQVLVNNMVRAPLFRHEVAFTDFLLIRQSTRSKTRWYIREIPSIFIVGQTLPVMEVAHPTSRIFTEYKRNRIRVAAYRLLQRCGDPMRKGMLFSDIQKIFPHYAEVQLKSRLKEFMEGRGLQAGRWRLKGCAPVPSEEQIRNMVSPEQVCMYDTVSAAVRRLEDLGFVDDGRDTLSPEELAVCDLEEELSIWKVSRNFIAYHTNKQLLKITGAGDPTGCGQGFSLTRGGGMFVNTSSEYVRSPNERNLAVSNVVPMTPQTQLSPTWQHQQKTTRPYNSPGSTSLRNQEDMKNNENTEKSNSNQVAAAVDYSAAMRVAIAESWGRQIASLSKQETDIPRYEEIEESEENKLAQLEAASRPSGPLYAWETPSQVAPLDPINPEQLALHSPQSSGRPAVDQEGEGETVVGPEHLPCTLSATGVSQITRMRGPSDLRGASKKHMGVAAVPPGHYLCIRRRNKDSNKWTEEYIRDERVIRSYIRLKHQIANASEGSALDKFRKQHSGGSDQRAGRQAQIQEVLRNSREVRCRRCGNLGHIKTNKEKCPAWQGGDSDDEATAGNAAPKRRYTTKRKPSSNSKQFASASSSSESEIQSAKQPAYLE